MPAYDELIFVTHRDLVKDSRLPRFLSAVEQAAIFITNHPQESWQLFIKAYPNLDDALNKQAFSIRCRVSPNVQPHSIAPATHASALS